MNIADISDDYDEMYGWYRDFVRAHADHAPIKTDTFETILGNSMGAAELPQLAQAIFRAARVGMDEWYRASLAYPEPSADEVRGVRSVFFTLGQLVESLPPMTFIRSLQNNPARQKYHQPDELGVGERSPHLPALRPEQPNRGYPEAQLPVRGPADIRPVELPLVSWEEVRRHADPSSLWVVIDGDVYDVTNFAARHPGGLDMLMSVAGRDATRAFREAGHSAVTEVLRLNYRIGRVAQPEAAPGDAEARTQPPPAAA
jgi:cytochrome b involved in lipid metabolism